MHLHELLMKIQKEERQYHMQHGRWPTDTHVAKTLNIPVEKLKMIKQVHIRPTCHPFRVRCLCAEDTSHCWPN